jgi:hypothetical protein
MDDISSATPTRTSRNSGVLPGWNRQVVRGNADSDAMKDLGKPGAGERHARIDERGLETGVRPDEATFIQRVKFPPRQGPASQRESSLAPREAMTAAKRRQSDRQAVTKVK